MNNYIEFNEHTTQYPVVIISDKIKKAQFATITDDIIAEELRISKPVKKSIIKPTEPSRFKYKFITTPNLKLTNGCLPLFIFLLAITLGWQIGDSFIEAFKITFIFFGLGLIYILLMSLFSDEKIIQLTKKSKSIKIPYSEEKIKRLEEEYTQKMEKYYIEKRKIENKFKSELETYKSKIKANRERVINDIYLRNLEPETCASRGELSPRRGTAELKFLEKLNSHLKEFIFVDMVPQLNSYSTSNTYNPDITLICPKTNLHIDIEIDEPYTLVDKKPIHYIDCGDDERNEFFLGLNWCIIRFTEKQVVENTLECIKTIKSVYDNIINMSIGYDNFLESIPRWTYEESLIMSKNQYREKYLNNNKYD